MLRGVLEHPEPYRGHAPAGQENTVRAFQKECQLLSELKHPMIVQYLGVHYDRGTRSSITLLMELMNENLLKYLESHDGPLPFCREVDIACDVALALEYLHGKGIQHRDLSSKNILLSTELRVKVSDFGMAKLNDPRSIYNSQTPVPGCPAYMPPEVLRETPTFSDKIDEFSLGVCMIQILSRQFPKPTDLIEYNEDSVRLVPELERRKDDIARAHDSSHQILDLAKQCLGSKPEDRPSAKQLRSELQSLRNTEMYQSSEKACKTDVSSSIPPGWTVINYLDEKIMKQNKELTEQIKDRKQKLSLQEKEVSQKTTELKSYQTQTVQLEDQVSQLNTKLEDLHELLKSSELLLNQKEAEIHEMQATMSYLNTEIIEQHSQNEVIRVRDSIEFKSELAAKDSLIQELRESLSSKDDEIQDLQLQMQKLKEPPLPKETALPFSPLDTLLGKQMKISWSDGVCPPLCQFNAIDSQVVCHNNKVCVSIGNPRQDSTAVWEYNFTLNLWRDYPCVPSSQCTIVFLRERLAGVGGHYSAAVLCLTNSSHPEWRPSFPLMTIARALPSCAFADPHLLVAGGEDRKETSHCNDVEILNIDTGYWQMVRPFPVILRAFKRLSVFAIQDSFYLLGGYNGDTQNQKIFECSLSGLIGRNPWKEVSISSRIGAAFAVSNGRLLSLGGSEDHSFDPSDDILSFNCKKKKWELVGKLRRMFKHGLIGAVTTDDKKHILVVIGKDFTDVGVLV